MPQITTGRYKNGYPPSAGIANAWVAQNNYLWGLAANTRDLCVGGGGAPQFVSTIYKGSFVYGGDPVLICDIVTHFSGLNLSIPNDGVTKTLSLAAFSTVSSFDISGGGAAYTIGKKYTLTASIGSDGAEIYWIAANQANGVLWPTLASFADGYVAQEADYAAITTAQQSLKNILEVPSGQGIRVSHQGIGNNDTFMFGGLLYRGQNTVTVTWWQQNGLPGALTVYGDAGWTDQFLMTVDAHEHTDTFTLTAGHYTVGNRYRWTIACPSTQTNYVDCISIGGVRSLTNPPQNFKSGDPYRGSTGAPGARMKPVGGSGATDNLTEIAVAAYGSPTIGVANHGAQFLSPVAIGATLQGTFNGCTYEGSFRRPHILQYLAWLPVNAGHGGTVTLAVAPAGVTDAQSAGYSFGLTDTQNGGWNVTELDSQPGLAYGQFYVVTGVSCCFEVATP